MVKYALNNCKAAVIWKKSQATRNCSSKTKNCAERTKLCANNLASTRQRQNRNRRHSGRYSPRKTKKAGYTPVCGNEWAKGVCEKPRVKCGKCPNRNLLPLTKDVIYRHLRCKDPLGEDVIGVYPMLPDETCCFVVADFDDENWREDVKVLREICRDNGLDAAVERSRSGKGGHVWFFFIEPVPCSLARKLVSVLLTLAMERRHDLSFKSYDRLIPNQDTMPSGGFGNLIALPFQGLAAQDKNSLFLDDSFEPYDDQWAYLSTVDRILPAQVEEIVARLGGGNELGVLASTEDNPNKPWEKKPAPAPLVQTDFPEHVQITRANGLYYFERKQ